MYGCNEATRPVRRKFLVASAANSVPVPDSSTVKPHTRPNPVALEVPVTATGTRPSDVAGQRDLFTEETSTVLVFRDGGVIRLNAAVALGQLVFLTNNQTRREVVCQVLRKRSLGAAGSYVELDFTEEVANFWGVEFPAEEMPQKKSAAVRPSAAVAMAEQMIESGRGASGDASPMPTAPSLQEVDELREEVEKLRQQLQSLLQVQEPGQAARMQAADSEPIVPGTQTPAWAKEATDMVLSGVAAGRSKPELMAANDPAPEAARQGSNAAEAEIRSRPTDRRAPFAEEEEALAAVEGANAEELLPKPALDFSQVPKTQKKADVARGRSGWSNSLARTTGVLLVVLGGVGGLAAWYKNLLPFLPRNKPAHIASASIVAGGHGGSTTLANGNAAVANASIAAKTAEASLAGTKPDAASGGSERVPEDSAERSADRNSPAENTAGERAEPAGSGAVSAREKKVARRTAGTESEVEVSEAAMDDGSVVPAKLLKSVSAVYPPDAMRNYITGDVIVDAIVHTNGKVGEMKVTTGPAALRDAAIEALKQYQYAPATQGGKAVASHVKVTVKFWFNP